MAGKIQFLIERRDEGVTIYCNGQEVGSANHDEDGWQGMGQLENLTKAIAEVLDAEVTES